MILRARGIEVPVEMRARLVLVPVVVGVALAACSGSESSPSPMDASAPAEDAGVDAALDASMRDAALPEDPLTRECPLTGLHFESRTSKAMAHSFALDVGVNTGHLVYGKSERCDDDEPGTDLQYVTLASNGMPSDATSVDAPSCQRHRDLALVASDDGVWAYFVRDQGDGDRLVAVDMSKGDAAEPVVLLEQAGRTSHALAAGLLGDEPAVVWASSAGPDAATEISLFFGATRGSRRIVLPASAGQFVQSLAIGTLGRGEETTSRSVLAWADAKAEVGAIRLQPIDTRGIAVGEPTVLSTTVGEGNRVDFASQLSGGALMFTDGAGLKQRTRLVPLDPLGKLMREPISITNLDQVVLDAAIARYAVGFAVPYRAVPDDPEREAVIRIAFTDNLGNIAGTRDVAPAARDIGLVRAVLARDGRLFVAWVDRDAEGRESVRTVRALCQ